ncbi:MAG: signal peptidase II [Actinomycetota bacterium]|nr:signal peptidase II [Actinomycetota bacterium]
MQAARGASLNPSELSSSELNPQGDDNTQECPDVSSAAPRDPHTQPRRLLTFAAVAVLVLGCDLASKVWAVASLQGEAPVTVIPGVLDLTFLRNPGAAFGMGTGYTVVLSTVAVGIAVALAALAHRLRDRTWAVALGLLLAGALGNLTDRVFRQPGFMRGHVVDFLELPSWPVFNIADVAITTAAILVVVQSLRGVTLEGIRERDRTAGDRTPW